MAVDPRESEVVMAQDPVAVAAVAAVPAAVPEAAARRMRERAWSEPMASPEPMVRLETAYLEVSEGPGAADCPWRRAWARSMEIKD